MLLLLGLCLLLSRRRGADSSCAGRGAGRSLTNWSGHSTPASAAARTVIEVHRINKLLRLRLRGVIVAIIIVAAAAAVVVVVTSCGSGT